MNISLEYDCYYRLKLWSGTTVRARYAGNGLFLNGNKSYGLDDIQEILCKLPG